MSTAGRIVRADVPPIYAIVDAAVVSDSFESVSAVVAAGVSWVQLRAKSLGDRDLCLAVEACLEISAAHGATLWVNDRPDVAAVVGASAVHLGQDDLPPAAARVVLGDDPWLGRSTHDLQQVEEAHADPAVDVIAVGPVFATSGKKNPNPVVGLELVTAARAVTDKPIVGIGGIGAANLVQVLAAGADSVAMIGALCRGDVGANCRALVASAQRLEAGAC
ncbi:MAG: thiamine phosphate synthase [Acidobacteriota bacterium]|nr:thiamine phosphate synthase [Acidobacteriota bacterium]